MRKKLCLNAYQNRFFGKKKNPVGVQINQIYLSTYYKKKLDRYYFLCKNYL